MHKLGVLAGALLIGAGVLVGVRMLSRIPASAGLPSAAAFQSAPAFDTPTPGPMPASPATSSAAQPAEQPPSTVVAGATGALPAPLASALAELDARIVPVSGRASAGDDADLVFTYAGKDASGVKPAYSQVFAVVDRFDTASTSIPWNQVEDAWNGANRRYRTLAILDENVPALESIFGPVQRATPITFDTVDNIIAALEDGTADLAIVPFDGLVPELAVFDVDGLNPLQTDERFDLAEYPLVASLTATLSGDAAKRSELAAFLDALPKTNRDPDRMTTVAMTGVTAMVRFTAARMDQRGAAWLAEDVGPELSRADITAISNEVPFVEGCETDLDPDNVVFCSKPEYIDALLAAGADIVGLTGNHQNDHGPEGGLRSLQYYEDAGLQVYGGGADKSSAMQPLVIEHNGNRIAFLGANSYGPQEAWATDFLPGSAPFDLNIMSAMIRELKQDGDADVVLAELQYTESYDVLPLPDQQDNFRALVRAGADVVTGVQSHVPQAVEVVDGGLILYGLGNFYFDQMWSDDTREGLIVLHHIYDGRHISTRLLPTILYDYGQPRFASPIDGARILQRVFDALPQ